MNFNTLHYVFRYFVYRVGTSGQKSCIVLTVHCTEKQMSQHTQDVNQMEELEIVSYTKHSISKIPNSCHHLLCYCKEWTNTFTASC